MRIRFFLLFILVHALILTGCHSITNELVPTDATTGSTEKQEVSISAEIDDMMVFSDLEHFNAYLLSTGDDTNTAELRALASYYLPAGIPEEYQIYKITAGSSDIGFWYLPEQNQTSPGAILDAESQQKHFLFLMMQDGYDLDTVLVQFGAENNNQQDGRYLIQRESEHVAIWQETDSVLILYLPVNYEVSDLDALCQVKEYVRSKDSQGFEVAPD